MAQYVYEHDGFCPVCDHTTHFVAHNAWYRDHLVCTRCGSVPRERAVALAIATAAPDWRTLRIHESSPSDHGTSRRLAAECPRYTATQFFPGVPLGQVHNRVRNENLEQQTFPNSSFDLVVTQDVMEHVFHPDLVCQQVARTLSANGHYVFSVPTYKEYVATRTLAVQTPAGIQIHGEPMYHSNPVDPKGSLVTFLYGYDLAENIYKWSGLDVCVMRFHDHDLGIIGEHTEIYTCRKSAPRSL